MKIQIDNKIILELNKTQMKVICNDIPDEIFYPDMERRVKYVISHKYERCFERLKKEWELRLKGRVDMIPLDNDSFAQLVFSQPDYKDRSMREAEDVE